MTDNQKIEDLKEEREKLLFSIQCSIRYHKARKGFFAGLHTVFVTLTLFFGAGAAYVSQFGAVSKLATPAIGFTIICVAILDLVLRVSERSFEHYELARRFYDLRKTVVVSENPTDNDLACWKSDRLDIEKDEPPTLRALHAIMYNRTLISMGRDFRYKLEIGPFQSFFAQFRDISPDSIDTAENKNKGAGAETGDSKAQ